MQCFSFHIPTEIIFGKGTEEKVADVAARHGGRRVFIVFGGGSVKKSGLLERIEESLSKANILFAEFGGVQPNPLMSKAKEGVREAAKFGADLILAVGGGSVIDTAKAIAHGAANLDTDIADFWEGKKEVAASLPVGVVLTISAAGSETSNSAVLTNDETGKKSGLRTELNRPAFAIMNPELTYTLPRKQLAAGIADIMMHTIDRYFTHETGNAFTDRVAEALLKNVIKYGKAAMINHRDYEAMSELMWCGSVSHNGFTALGREMDFGVHKLAHELSGRYGATHGETLTAMWGSWARRVYADAPERFAEYATNVWDVSIGTPEERSRAGIRLTEEYWHELGLPLCFTELGIGVKDDAEIEKLADMLTDGGKNAPGVFHKLDRETAIEIYKMANH